MHGCQLDFSLWTKDLITSFHDHEHCQRTAAGVDFFDESSPRSWPIQDFLIRMEPIHRNYFVIWTSTLPKLCSLSLRRWPHQRQERFRPPILTSTSTLSTSGLFFLRRAGAPRRDFSFIGNAWNLPTHSTVVNVEHTLITRCSVHGSII